MQPSIKTQSPKPQTCSTSIFVVRPKSIFRGLSRLAAGAGAFTVALVFAVLGLNAPASGQG